MSRINHIRQQEDSGSDMRLYFDMSDHIGRSTKFTLCLMAEKFIKDEQFQHWVAEETGSPVDAAGACAFILATCETTKLDKIDRDKQASDRFIKLIHHPYTFWEEIKV